MRALIAIFLLLSGSRLSAKTVLRCSNSDGSVKWELGQADNLIKLKYSNFVDGVLSLTPEQVNIHIASEILLREKPVKNCHFLGIAKVFAGKVKIIPSEKNPDILKAQFPENQIQTEVICSSLEGESLRCDI